FVSCSGTIWLKLTPMGIAPTIHGLGKPIRRRVGAIPCGRPDNDTHFLAFRLSSGSTLRSFYRSSAAVTGLGSLFPRKLIRFVYHCQVDRQGQPYSTRCAASHRTRG